MKYRSKPVEIEAFKWTGGPDQTEEPDWIVSELASGAAYILHAGTKKAKMMLKHASGLLMVRQGDYIIKGTKPGDIYPCPADVFEEKYEAV